MDGIDEQIIGHLRENARRSFSELGRLVGLSTNATAARVRKLEAEGTILGYTLLEGANAPGPRGGLEVFVDVCLDPELDYETFTARIKPVREVVEAIHMTGPYDYLLRAYVPDTGALDRLLRRLKKECGAAQTQTRVALRAR